MTYCDTLAKPLIEKIELENKTLDQIAKELCGNTVKRPRQKVIRIIKELMGEEFLIKHADSLGYNTAKAVRQKSTSSEPLKGKIVSENNIPSEEAATHSDFSKSAAPIINISCCQKEDKSDASNNSVPEKKVSCDAEKLDDCQKIEVSEAINKDFEKLLKEINRLIKQFSLDDVKRALTIAEEMV